MSLLTKVGLVRQVHETWNMNNIISTGRAIRRLTPVFKKSKAIVIKGENVHRLTEYNADWLN